MTTISTTLENIVNEDHLRKFAQGIVDSSTLHRVLDGPTSTGVVLFRRALIPRSVFVSHHRIHKMEELQVLAQEEHNPVLVILYVERILKRLFLIITPGGVSVKVTDLFAEGKWLTEHDADLFLRSTEQPLNKILYSVVQSLEHY